MIDNKKHLGGECVDSYILCLYVLQSSQRNKSEKIQPILYLHWIDVWAHIFLILFSIFTYIVCNELLCQRNCKFFILQYFKKVELFFFFTWQREILTSVFHLLTWLLTFKFWTTAFNMLGLIAQMGQWTPSKYTQKCSWRFAIWP